MLLMKWDVGCMIAYRGCGDVEEISNVDVQPEDFKTWAKFFGWMIAMAGHKTKTPSHVEGFGLVSLLNIFF